MKYRSIFYKILSKLTSYHHLDEVSISWSQIAHCPPIGQRGLNFHICFLQGQRLTYTHFTSKVNWNSMIEITFNRCVCMHALWFQFNILLFVNDSNHMWDSILMQYWSAFSVLFDESIHICRSVKINKNKVYRIGMVLNKASTTLLWILNSENFHPNIWYIHSVPPWIVQMLRLVGIRWECAPAGSTRKAPFSLSASANPMIRSGMVSSGWKAFCWCTSTFTNCLGLSFFPGLRTRAGQPAEEKSKVETAKNLNLRQKFSGNPEEKSYRIHIWCCESPTLPRPS